MKMNYKNNNLIISDCRDFNLENIFECGQCFRWNKQNEGEYIGVALGKVLKIAEKDGEIVFYNTTKEDFENVWCEYFDIKRDYEEIRKTFEGDNVLKEAIGFGKGIRLLNQSLWECVVSFIISASNNIPRIKKIVELLCKNFGEETEYMGSKFYTFPTPQKIAELSIEDLAPIRAGFRDKYILDAAKKFVLDERFSKEYLKGISLEEAKKLLMTIKGVGTKVADCVLLFSLEKYESFPIDVWMKRIMEYCYFDKTEQDIKIIAEFSKKQFGNLAGFAQQYLFFYARENKIGVEDSR